MTPEQIPPPPRIKAWPWNGKRISGQWHVAGLGETTDYVRGDLFAAQAAELATLRAERDAQETAKDSAYLERNKLVALLASIFPSGIKRTAIEGWSEDWHGCVYIDFPWGQASWHYHDSQAALFDFLPPYAGVWDGHTTDEKYEALVLASRSLAVLKGGA